jgi:hypothetical protein
MELKAKLQIGKYPKDVNESRRINKRYKRSRNE